MAITHPDSKMGFPEVDLGVCPAVVAPWLVGRVGAGQARRILLQGGTMTGLRAFEMGMISHCVPVEELDKKTAELAEHLATAGPQALRATKNLLNEIDGPRLFELVRKGAVLSAQVVEGAEARSMLAKKLGA
jgi:enoyl-CoA hydratase/carnithine racemase